MIADTLMLPCEHGRFIDINPARTALACIDFQTDFVAPEGMGATRGLPVEHLAAALPAAQRALAAARRAGMFVFHTREAYAPDLSDLNMYRRRFDSSIGSMGPLGRFLIRGERGTEILESMRPCEGEPTVDKAGFNAFHNTSLDTMLRVRGIETLLIMGFTTQCCVASTFRGGVDTGYCCVLLQDACGAFDPADHQATVNMTYSESHNFGWVSDSAKLESTLRSLALKGHAA